MTGLRDQDASLHPHDPRGLAEDDLNLSRVLFVRAAHCLANCRRFDRAQVDQLTLGLADDLVGDDDDIAVLQFDVVGLQGRLDQADDIVARLNFRNAVEANDLY